MNETVLDDGGWHAVTIGVFLQLLVDAGRDPAVMFRVLEDGASDERGNFTRRIDMIMLPDGYVRSGIESTGADVHEVLARLMEAGLVR